MTAPDQSEQPEQPNLEGPWTMWAGIETVPDDPEGRERFLHVTSNKRGVSAYGKTPEPVVVYLDPDGAHWGLLRTHHMGEPRDQVSPSLVYDKESQFRICFPMDPFDYAKTGEGRVVRLRVERLVEDVS